MLEQLKPPPDPALAATGDQSRRPRFGQGALIIYAAGFGLAAICGYMAWVSGPDLAFIILLLSFGWLVSIVSLLAADAPSKLPIILLAGLAFGVEGFVLVQQSRTPPAPIELNNRDLKLYIKDFSQRLRDSELPYKSKFAEITRRLNNPALSPEDNDVTARHSEDYKRLLRAESDAFRDKYLLQSTLLHGELLRRLGPKYPGALYPRGDSRGASIESDRLMLKEGNLESADLISQIGDYLVDLANRLP